MQEGWEEDQTRWSRDRGGMSVSCATSWLSGLLERPSPIYSFCLDCAAATSPDGPQRVLTGESGHQGAVVGIESYKCEKPFTGRTSWLYPKLTHSDS